MRLKLLSIVLATSIAFGAMAQFDTGSGVSSRQAWEQFKLPNKKLKLDFRNANVDMVLSLFTKTSGITIVKDPALTQPLTLTSATAVPLNEAFEILNAALSVRNFELKKEGNLLVIRPRQNQNRGQGGRGGFGSSEDIAAMMQALGGSSNTELKLYRLEYANASQVARVINDVFNQNQNPFSNLMRAFGGGAFGGGGQRGGNRFGGGNTGGFNLSNQPTVRASSDDYSNTVIVNASRSQHSQIADLLKQIDQESDTPLRSKVYKLEFAAADQLQPVIQNVLQTNVPRGRGGASSNNQPIDRQFSFFPFGNNQNRQNNTAAGSVIAEARTNSLIVTTTEANQALIENVVKELDTEVKLEATTFVFPLDNARADQVSTLFQQAFGTRQGARVGGMNAGALNNRTGQTRTNNRTNQRRTNPLGGTQSSISPDELVLALADPSGQSGELATSVDIQDQIAQFFGGGQVQQQTQNRQSQGATGRDSSGRLVQVQDLTNQITVIPDQNTNSLIVVTTPENAELLRQILAQLDKIPEQVMIETIIVEATLDAQTKLGIEWEFLEGKAFSQPGATGQGNQDFGLRPNNALPQGFRYTVNTRSINAFVNALKTDSKFNVLSTPRIFTSNNVEAQINISQRVPYVVSQRVDANGNLTFNYDFEDVGIVLTVTPRITAGGYVTMDVSQTANDLQGYTSFNAPIVNQRQADTTVAVKDGETVILGGIIRSTVSTTVKKIPIIGDIPLLGQLFRSTDRTNQKTELLVFLTPRVVRNPDEASQMTEEQKQRLSKQSQKQLDGLIKERKSSEGKQGEKDDNKDKSKDNGGKR